MSNTWYYNLLVNPQPVLSEEEIGRIENLAEACGYSVKNPITGQITVARANVEPSDFPLKFSDFDTAATLLGSGGGLLDLWKDDIDIGLGFDPRGEEQSSVIEALKLSDTPTFGQISISVGNHFLRPDARERWQVARDVQQLFGDLCVSQKARYGYSADEDALENFMHTMHIHDDTRFQRRPSVLFWLNYFATEYAIRIGGSGAFQQMGGKIKELPTGIVVSFFEYPWEVDLAKLHAINDEWRKLK